MKRQELTSIIFTCFEGVIVDNQVAGWQKTSILFKQY